MITVRQTDELSHVRNRFIHWYNDQFKRTKLYTKMLDVSEGSPWHREHNVAVHTDMVVMEYLYRPISWDKADVLGAFAAAFHDVGKPGTIQEKWKEERGNYLAFNGHELLSARLWEDWAVRNWTILRDNFDFEPIDIYRVGYMIEFHKPWDIRKQDKLNMISLTLWPADTHVAFVNLIRADTWGRISDDQEEKRMKVNSWCNEFLNRTAGLEVHSLHYETDNPKKKPVMYVTIAASGSGKTTALNEIHAAMAYGEGNTTPEMLNVFSLDRMRVELYGEPYEDAFFKSTRDKHFRSKCNDRFRDLLRQNRDIFLDNTNTSRKNRRFYLTEAKNRGYFLRAMLLPVDLQTIKDRQSSRPEKTVPLDAVERQYNGLQLPQIGEFDDVVVLDGNLPK